MKRIMLAAALICVMAPAARAIDGEKLIGSWLVTSKEDRFGDGGTFAAITGDGGAHVLAVRCIEKNLSIGIGLVNNDPKPLTEGDLFTIKLRIDKEPVMETIGVAINDRLIQVDTQADMVRTMRKGKETAVRVENKIGVAETAIFRTTGTAKAFERLAQECKLD